LISKLKTLYHLDLLACILADGVMTSAVLHHPAALLIEVAADVADVAALLGAVGCGQCV